MIIICDNEFSCEFSRWTQKVMPAPFKVVADLDALRLLGLGFSLI